MELHFGCTQCGKCCRNLELPLTVSEATILCRLPFAIATLDPYSSCIAGAWPRSMAIIRYVVKHIL
jgi:hypothetical protein